MQGTPLILTKLIPPTTASTFMRRASFIKRIKLSSQMKLTLLHSGAGYGKSSNLSSYFHETRTLHSWYSVTEEDDDILPFLKYLTSSIQQAIPTFGQSMNWGGLSAFPKEKELERWIALFVNELCAIDEPLSVVIDDFHHIDHVFHINYVLEKIIEFMPDTIHFIIATRTYPRWPSLLKLKLMGQLCEITEEDFIFSEEEVSVFFEDYFNHLLTEEEASNIVQMTEGWAIAINLLAIHMTDSEKPFTTAMKPALYDLFSYLSEEVYTNMSEEERDWLLSFSVFPVFSKQLIYDFYGEPAAEALQNLAKRHIFIQSLGDDGTYRYHALFQQFLERKWQSQDFDHFVSLHKKAADFYIQKGNPFQAIMHAQKSKDEQYTAKTVVTYGSTLIQSGQFEWLLDILKELSSATLDEFYPLHYYAGEAYRYRAYYETAQASYIACMQIAEQYEDFYFISRANAGIAHIYLDTIQPGLAESYLSQAIHFAQASKRTSSQEMQMLKRQFAENLVNLGKAAAAKKWISQETLDQRILREGNLDARIALRTGNLEEAQALLTTRINDTSLPDSHRETDVLLSLIYSMTAQVDLAMTSAARGIQLGKKEKSGFIEAVGWIRMGHAKILSDPSEIHLSKQYYFDAIHRMEELQVSRGKAEPYMGLSMLSARHGLFPEAIQYGEAGLRETEKVNDGWLSALIRIGLAIGHFYANNDEEAERHAKEAGRLVQECGDTYGEMIVSFWLMKIYNRIEAQDLFLKHAAHFLSICFQQQYLFFLTSDTLFSPFDRQSMYPLLIKASVLDPDHADIQKAITYLQLEDVPAHPGYKINVQLLGPLTVQLGLDEVSDTKWQRDKAKELFLYLLLNKQRFVPKEEIIQELWMDADEKSADRDFKVALNALLKVIEPNRSARENSFFILRKQSMYRLNPNADIQTDVEQFKQCVEMGLAEKTAQEAVEQLLKAVALYKGSLFEEKRLIEWIVSERQLLEQQYIQAMERLAQSYIRLREFMKTVYWAEKILRIDPTWEEAYRLLMYAHYQLQNRSQSIKWYQKCKKVLEEEFAIMPMETTEQMYKMIVNEL